MQKSQNLEKNFFLLIELTAKEFLVRAKLYILSFALEEHNTFDFLQMAEDSFSCDSGIL